MKTSSILPAAAAAVFLLVATSALRAGPGPQFWNQVNTARKAPAAAKTTAVATPAGPNQAATTVALCQNCAGCRTAATSKAGS